MKAHKKEDREDVRRSWKAPILVPYLRGFRPKRRLQIAAGPFLVKTAENEWEAQRAVALRHACFGHDVEPVDFDADHVIVLDTREQNRVVAAARLASSRFAELDDLCPDFHVEHLLRSRGEKIEISRICVSPEWRNGATLALLIRGVSHYLRAAGALFLLMQLPVRAEADLSAPRLMKYMIDLDLIETRFSIEPRHGSRIMSLPGSVGRFAKADASTVQSVAKLSPFLKSLIRAKARFCLIPAVAKEAQGCVGFLAVMELACVPYSLRKRWTRSSDEPAPR